MPLIIVESPTKARTFNAILKDKNFYVFATLGHIRDLPATKLSVHYESDFKPDYEIMAKKKKVVDQMKKLAKDHSEIIIATDLDREGESIAYHAAYLMGFMDENWPDISIKKSKKKLQRIVFHEITKNALLEALKHPESLRFNLVRAQQSRRILDRIVGYELSPLLWQKLGKNWVSAGRVQSVALRFVVEREKEIDSFNKEEYFQIFGLFKNGEEVLAKLIAKDETSYEIKNKIALFSGSYEYVKTSISEKNVTNIAGDIQKDSFSVEDVKEAVSQRYPPPPFTTSLLQQEAINRFGFSSKMIMRIAQDLYERGYITYHRTDSFNLSSHFVFRAKDYIAEQFGKEYAFDKPRGYRTKSKSAQEAHEAIRPTRLDRTSVEMTRDKRITKNHKLIYELIFNRALATQMKEAEINVLSVLIRGKKGYLFRSEYQNVIFDGFLKILAPEFAKKHKNKPTIKIRQNLNLLEIKQERKETQPPPRYTEASLIKILEEHDIGRPSTYSPILSLIQEKSYVEKEGRYLRPTPLGSAISDYLSGAFSDLFDINFTAQMEDSLDQVAEGKKDFIEVLKEFYDPFHTILDDRKKDKKRIEVKDEVFEPCPKCGNPLVVKMSRYGKFYACSTYPSCKFTKPYLKFVSNKQCRFCTGRIVVRYTKTKRRFYGCENYPDCKFISFSYAKL